MFRRALCALQTGKAENGKPGIFHVSLDYKHLHLDLDLSHLTLGAF